MSHYSCISLYAECARARPTFQHKQTTLQIKLENEMNEWQKDIKWSEVDVSSDIGINGGCGSSFSFSIFSRFITLSTACCVRMVRVSVMLLHRRIKFNNLLFIFILLILRVHHTIIRARLNNATPSNLRGSGCSPEDIGKKNSWTRVGRWAIRNRRSMLSHTLDVPDSLRWLYLFNKSKAHATWLEIYVFPEPSALPIPARNEQFYDSKIINWESCFHTLLCVWRWVSGSVGAHDITWEGSNSIFASISSWHSTNFQRSWERGSTPREGRNVKLMDKIEIYDFFDDRSEKFLYIFVHSV